MSALHRAAKAAQNSEDPHSMYVAFLDVNGEYHYGKVTEVSEDYVKLNKLYVNPNNVIMAREFAEQELRQIGGATKIKFLFL